MNNYLSTDIHHALWTKGARGSVGIIVNFLYGLGILLESRFIRDAIDNDVNIGQLTWMNYPYN